MKLSEIHINPKNPRLIRNGMFEKLVQSLKEFPEMMELRPIIVDDNNIIQGGNMRYRALKELGYKEIPDTWVKKGKDLTPEQWREFVVKDNLAYGEWDMDMLSSLYDAETLESWGIDPLLLGKDVKAEREEAFLKLKDRFLVPPFSILDTTQQYWSDRKDLWRIIGIKSELGRTSGLTYASTAQPPRYYEIKNELRNKYSRTPTTEEVWDECERRGIKLYGDRNGSTSIFDPVLCEIMYQWFTPDGGTIMDPFAGGSVRGIVASVLGYKYYGNDLSEKQIKANKQNAREVLTRGEPMPIWTVGDSTNINEIVKNNIPQDWKDTEPKQPKTQRIKISNKSLKLKFQPCEPDYIKNVCHGRCCEGANGLMVTVHDSEIKRIEAIGAHLGVTVKNNFIVDKDKTGLCPFKTKEGLCSIHEDKPFGCKAIPFTLNKNDTLIIRNRYRLLRCYNTPEAIPAYKAHQWSLRQIFKDKTDQLIGILESTEEDFYFDMDYEIYKILVDNDRAKHPDRKEPETQNTQYDVTTPGDETFDLIFSCPPYADLEVYSDDPRDISNMKYEDFKKTYFQIIAESVKLLKYNRFAIFTIADVRDKSTGFYRNFISDTIEAFQETGMSLYNEFILINQIGSAAIRANRQFNKGRKNVKRHQNVLVFYKDSPAKSSKKIRDAHEKVLVFYKGDPEQIKKNYGTIDLSQNDILSSFIEQEIEEVDHE